MYELNEQELAFVVGGGGSVEAEVEVEKSFNNSLNNNKVNVKNVKVTAKGDYSSATAVFYVLSPEVTATASK